MTATTQRAPTTPPPAPAPGTIAAAPLVAALKRCAVIAPPRSSNILFTFVRLTSAGGALTLEATNPDARYTETIDAPDLPPFTALVNPRRLHKILSCVDKGGSVELDYTDTNLRVTIPSLGLTVNLAGSPADGYPDAPATKPFLTCPVPREEFLTGLRCVRGSLKGEQFNAIFRSGWIVPLTDGSNNCEVAASDGYSVSMYRYSFYLPKTLIPLAGVGHLLTLLGGQGTTPTP